MVNELFNAWKHAAAPVQDGLDTVRNALVAIENGRPLDPVTARHVEAAFRKYLAGENDITKNLGLRPGRGRSNEAPLRRERLLLRDRLICSALHELGGNTPQNRLELQSFLDAYELTGPGGGFMEPIMELRSMHSGQLQLSEKQLHRIAAGEPAYARCA